jgi:transcriptional regulator with XRE-family HTH domain
VFGDVLKVTRGVAGRTQEDVARRSGIARPNVAAAESGSREPRWDTAVRLLEAAGGRVEVVSEVVWGWTSGRRPYAVPSCLWRLSIAAATREVEPGVELWWSGPKRRFDLADRADRLRLYEVVLREGGPEDIESIVDGALLVDAWPDLVLPVALRAAWEPMIDAVRHERAIAS